MQLHVPHIRINSIQSNKFIVSALLSDLALLENDNVVRVSDCTKSMGNNQYCPLFSETIESFLYATFRECI